MVKIAVIGSGYVGSVAGACLADFGNHVLCVDSDAEKIALFNRGIIPLYEPGLDKVVERNRSAGRLIFTTDLSLAVRQSEVIFIAVGTPCLPDGGADISLVEKAARSIGSLIDTYKVVVTKSTVPVGTGRKIESWIAEELARRGSDAAFAVASNPEFLREGTAVYDFTHPDRVVIGASSKKAFRQIKRVYRSLYLNETPYIETDLESAEMIKYASNAFLAVKIAFINEIACLCEQTGADVQDVARAAGRDGRIGSKFLHPGPGYGGSCFPKDTCALAKTGRDYGAAQSIVEAAIKSNDVQKIRAAKKIQTALGRGKTSLEGKTVAVLGLAFKPNTSDMRESPAIAICGFLAGQGAKLRVYDPAAMEEARHYFMPLGEKIFFAAGEYDAASGADALAIVTEWNQFRNIDLLRIKELLHSPLFFDFRNIYKRKEVEAAGLEYIGTGKKSGKSQNIRK